MQRCPKPCKRESSADTYVRCIVVRQVLGALRPLLPRLYSISSSQLEGAARVAVTVAVVRYVSLGRPRIGVTSTYTAERVKARLRPTLFVALCCQ